MLGKPGFVLKCSGQKARFRVEDVGFRAEHKLLSFLPARREVDNARLGNDRHELHEHHDNKNVMNIVPTTRTVLFVNLSPP